LLLLINNLNYYHLFASSSAYIINKLINFLWRQ